MVLRKAKKRKALSKVTLMRVVTKPCSNTSSLSFKPFLCPFLFTITSSPLQLLSGVVLKFSECASPFRWCATCRHFPSLVYIMKYLSLVSMIHDFIIKH